MLFVLQQPQEECMEEIANLFSTYVVLTQGFDTVSRKGLWRIMAKYGCPRKFNAMVQQFHYWEASQPFPVSSGVKQDCILSPTLSRLMFSAMLTDPFRDGDGISIKYGTNVELFNLRELQSKTKALTDIITDFSFADDCTLNVALSCSPVVQAN